VADYQGGRSVRQLVRTYAINRTTVLDHLERRGVARRRNVRKLTDDDVQRAAHMYRSGASLIEVGERFAVDASTLGRELDRAGVRRRPPGRPRSGGGPDVRK
jgi:hypothetical protein